MLITLQTLGAHYQQRKKEIQKRLLEFEHTFSEGGKQIFEELCFCILAANTSSKMSQRCVEALRPVLFTGKSLQMKQKLVGIYRFINLRPAYIYHTRTYLEKEHGFRLKELILSFSDPQSLRDFFALNPDIKGIGYKEASHFLRNIGHKGYCILDKHILNCLCELHVIPTVERPSTRKKYFEIEEQMKAFSERIGINVDELDLALWSMKTGEVLK